MKDNGVEMPEVVHIGAQPVPDGRGGGTLGLLACFSLVGLKVSLRRFSARPVGVGAASQRWILAGEQSSLLTRIATTENISLFARMKS